jgi:hypothetical protein
MRGKPSAISLGFVAAAAGYLLFVQASVAQPLLPWLDRPPGQAARPVCPGPGQWLLAYWSNTQTLAESTLYSCPSVDRLWTLAEGRWFGYSRVFGGASDVFLISQGQAAFLHGAEAPAAMPPIPLPTAAVLTPIDLVTVTSPVQRGQTADFVVATEPGTLCTVQFVGPTLQPQMLPDLPPKASDDFGFVRWSWTVPPTAPRGPASLLVRCGTGVRAAHFEIQ